MANTLHITRTKFISLDEAGRATSESWGFRAYDDMSTTYSNLFDTLDELLGASPEDLIRLLARDNDVGRSLVAYPFEFGRPVYVDEEPIRIPDDLAKILCK